MSFQARNRVLAHKRASEAQQQKPVLYYINDASSANHSDFNHSVSPSSKKSKTMSSVSRTYRTLRSENRRYKQLRKQEVIDKENMRIFKVLNNSRSVIKDQVINTNYVYLTNLLRKAGKFTMMQRA